MLPLSVNDKGDNELVLVARHKSLGIYFIIEETAWKSSTKDSR